MKKYILWLGRAIRPQLGHVTLMMLCHVILAVCSVFFVYICKKLVDIAVAVFNGNLTVDSVWKWLLFMAGVVIFRILLNAWRSYLQTKTEIRLKNNLRTHLFDILLRLQNDGGRKHHTGDILNRVQEDVRVVSSAVAAYIPNFFGAVLQFGAALIFLLYLDIRLALVLVIVLPVGMLVGKFITGRIRNLTLDIRNRDSRVQSHLQESIQHITLLQTLEYEETSSGELTDLQNKLYSSELRRTRFSVVSRIFVALAFQAGYAVAFMWGVLGISCGTVTYGMMTAFLQLVGQIQRPLLEMSSQLPAIIHSTASIDRILELESLPCEEDSDPIMLEGVAGISIDNITFTYPDSSVPVLENFSHDFKPGSRTAIVGPTGVGKSTLIRLLLALLRPQKGNISVYTEGAKAAISPSTRCNLVYVPQGNSLFSGTVRDNLIMGNPNATDEQMSHALYLSAAEFVLEHPDGLDMKCFASGGGLSEGQAQRIAIARALLRPGSILLLDEFSSALDAKTEILLMERLTSAMADHTMIFITHREKIIDYCTDVVRINK